MSSPVDANPDDASKVVDGGRAKMERDVQPPRVGACKGP